MDNATQAPAGWGPEAAQEPSADCPLQADFQYFLFTVTYSAVFVLGLLENGAALYLLACRAQKAPRSYIFLVNLVVVDALFAATLPFKIHYHYHGNHWPFGDLACRLTGCAFFLNIYLSIAFFTCVCADRYVAVRHPFAYLRVRSGHYGAVAAALWVAALGVAGPLVLEGPLHTQAGNRTVCFENFQPGSWTGRMAPYNACALVFGFALPFGIILVSYPLVAQRIARLPPSAHTQKALGTIYLVLFICTACLLPYHLTHLLHFLMRAGLITHCPLAAFIYRLRRITLALVSFNCCLNPVLYFFTAAGRQRPFRLRKRTTRVYTIGGGKTAPRRRPPADGTRLVRAPQKLVGV